MAKHFYLKPGKGLVTRGGLGSRIVSGDDPSVAAREVFEKDFAAGLERMIELEGLEVLMSTEQDLAKDASEEKVRLEKAAKEGLEKAQADREAALKAEAAAKAEADAKAAEAKIVADKAEADAAQAKVEADAKAEAEKADADAAIAKAEADAKAAEAQAEAAEAQVKLEAAAGGGSKRTAGRTAPKKP